MVTVCIMHNFLLGGIEMEEASLTTPVHTVFCIGGILVLYHMVPILFKIYTCNLANWLFVLSVLLANRYISVFLVSVPDSKKILPINLAHALFPVMICVLLIYI